MQVDASKVGRVGRVSRAAARDLEHLRGVSLREKATQEALEEPECQEDALSACGEAQEEHTWSFTGLREAIAKRWPLGGK